MGIPQRDFLSRFRVALIERFPKAMEWGGGQVVANSAALNPKLSLRRDGRLRSGERFELGDLLCTLGNKSVIVEYESGGIAAHNLLKYWPYVRGELSSSPSKPIVLCHFSNWSSYGSHRDLWDWLAFQITADCNLKVEFVARQFDHWGADLTLGEKSIVQCLDWLESVVLQNA